MDLNNNEDYLSEKHHKAAIEKPGLETPIGENFLSAKTTKDLLHELRVHQFELEVQNEELKHSQIALELSRKKYFKIYDIAPIGYCTLNACGLVMEANLKACELFGLDRIYLKRQLFSSFIFKDDLHLYYHAVNNISTTGDSQTCEVRFMRRNHISLWVLLDISSMQDDDDVFFYLVAVSDITGRKNTEIELQQGHERMANILEATNSGNWEWNVQTGEVAFSDRWAEIIGYALEEISPISIKTWERFAHPEDLQKSNEQLSRVFKREAEYYDIECRMKHKNGNWIWVQDRGKVISWTADKKPLWMSGTHNDINERKQSEILSDQLVVFTEEMLGTEKERVTYQKILENLLFISKAKYGFLTLKNDTTNKFTTVAVAGIKNNVKNFKKLLGFELMGKEWDEYPVEYEKLEGQAFSYYPSVSEITEGVIPKKISKPIEKLLNLGETIVTKVTVNNEMIGDFTLIMPHGQKFKNYSFVKIYSRQLDMFLTRIKAEDMMSNNKARLDFALKSAHMGVWEFDIVKNKRNFDNQACVLLGIDPISFNGTAEEFYVGVHPDDLDKIKAALLATINEGILYEPDYRILSKDGSIHYITARAELHRASDGGPETINGIIWDITERKKIEDKVLHLSYHDMLTGLYNRRFFEEEIKRLDTERQIPLSIIMGDLNSLKLINDTFGHWRVTGFL